MVLKVALVLAGVVLMVPEMILVVGLIRYAVGALGALCKNLTTGIIIRVFLCWNFGRLVPGTLGSHRYQTKTHGSHHLGAQFGHKISSN